MICVPIANDNLNDIISNAKRALKLDADLLEFRIDYFQDIGLNSIKKFEALTNFQVPMILTCRKKSEGGKANIKENLRIKILHKIIDLKPSYIDLEFSIDNSSLEKLINRAHDNDVEVILSYHNFERTESMAEIENLINSMNKMECNVLKIVMMAKTIYDNNIAFNLLKKTDQNGKEMISFCMGPLGVVSRIMCPFFGSKFTFASLDIPTAPGQISIQEMKKIHNLVKKNIN
ncbi:MAG: type I 3-dehydroquinate dehydratase [Candidatus Lokiarchaeota archaeon]|nr:type I 3-dehydroquinate dehydratase [Candidatus Lokiarchaeota archaeon]